MTDKLDDTLRSVLQSLFDSEDCFIGAEAWYRPPGRPMVAVGMDEFVALRFLFFERS